MRMTNRLIRFLFVVFALAAGHGVADDEIYRWVDEDGVVHFGDKTEAHPGAEKVNINPVQDNGLGKNLPHDMAEADQPADPEISPAQQKRDERAARKKAAAEQQQQTAATCQQARERVATLEPSPRVLVKNEDGSVNRMDDNQRLELLDEAKAYIAANCDN